MDLKDLKEIEANVNDLTAATTVNEVSVDQAPVSADDPDTRVAKAMTICFGSAAVSLLSNGKLELSRAKSELDQACYINYAHSDVIEHAIGRKLHLDPGSLPDVVGDDQFTWKAGICIVTGPANTGKSPILKWFNQRFESRSKLIRFGEPLPGYYTLDSEAALAFTSALLDPKVDIICLDSIKDLLVSMSYGGTMARGIPRSIFRFASQLGTIASTLGKLIVVPLNVSTDNADAIKEVTEAVHSNSTTAMVGTIAGTDTLFAISQRNGESRIRTSAVATLRFKDGDPDLTIKVENPGTRGNVNAVDVSTALIFDSNSPIVNSVVSRMMKRASALNTDSE